MDTAKGQGVLAGHEEEVEGSEGPTAPHLVPVCQLPFPFGGPPVSLPAWGQGPESVQRGFHPRGNPFPGHGRQASPV